MSDVKLAELKEKLFSGKESSQMPAIPELASYGSEGLAVLEEFITQRQGSQTAPTPIDGKLHQTLLGWTQGDVANQALDLANKFYRQGVLPLRSAKNVDYQELQELLAKGEFEAADKLTNLKLCEAANNTALQRGWLYFTDVRQIPNDDLQMINDLWVVYSEGKFGFSVQRKIWLSLGKNWEKLWRQIGWKKDGSFTRYPTEFSWNLTAPKGHLPLSNQLRGNKAIQALFAHPLWS